MNNVDSTLQESKAKFHVRIIVLSLKFKSVTGAELLNFLMAAAATWVPLSRPCGLIYPVKTQTDDYHLICF